MKILITGGAGFIGSNFIRHMLVKYPNYEIINLDKLTYAGNLNNLKDIEKNKKYSFLKGDICDKKIVEKLIKKVNVIINFAAESHVDRSIIKSDTFIQTNVFGTYILLQAAKELKIKKFIHISTDEVYGSIDSGSFKEDSSLKPSSPYSASKASSDMLVTAFNVTYDLPTIITRSTNNFGPFQYPEKLIPLFITNLLEGKKIPLYGDGLNVRDWLYVIDNCEAIDFLIHHGKEGEIYNISADNEKTNLEITKKILNFLEKDETFIEYVTDRLGHDRRYSLDCNKIKKLGWKPKFEFNKALEITVNWYKDNKWWWQPLKERMAHEF
jgi:dTDP-glucose 4,6-dehydratase